ncbi:SUMF1/EgtB/PvdO family nonheme iron enzyme [candidate division KSB1 bacterium]|nr:SUMF1/EgtB/PvdO family nonheme iron enzyme [candidate division KSB1 bacterium]
MILIKGGTFQMGDTNGIGEADEVPVHEVTLSDFYLSPYEVTQKEWQDIMGDNPSKFKGDNLPVENVSWYDAVEFCNKKSEAEGLAPCYRIDGENVSCDFSANGYRLPTEAEWEYAARGGNKAEETIYSGSDNPDKVAWYVKNSKETTHPVGQKSANELGLYDMSGNVYEWTWTRYHKYPSEPQTNPVGPDRGGHRMFRGASWFSIAENLRVSFRNRDHHEFKSAYLGLRLCRSKK